MDAAKIKNTLASINEVLEDENLSIRFMYILINYEGEDVAGLIDELNLEFSDENISNDQVIKLLYKVCLN